MNWIKEILKSESVIAAAKTLGKAVLYAALATLGVSFAGCSTMATTPRGQTTEIVAVGVPAIAWISHTSQDAEHSGSDTITASQSATNGVTPSVSASLGK